MAKARVSVADSIFKVERKAFLRLCEGINTPRALTCFMLASVGQWDDLVSLGISPSDYLEPGAYADDALVTEIMTKCPRLPLEVDREAVAIQKFWESEEKCAETNRRFRSRVAFSDPPSQGELILRKARLIIKRALGELTSRDLDSIPHRARFGPGATSDVKGQAVSLSRKYCTLGATPRLRDYWKLLPRLWLEAARYEIHRPVLESYVTTVPKNAKTDRTICVEPHLNIMVQLGIAGLLRQRLRRAGIDLRTQEWNRFLASKAEEWQLATIDLSSASDNISEAVVEFLLPPRWLHLLRMARTEYTTMERGSRDLIPLQKWSSMGNGYTFELETLIFWALAKAVSAPGSIVSAYGDDIICPQASTGALVDALEYCGFSVNRAKSFLGGEFFESCGSDWFKGVSVRPIYFRAEVKDYSKEDMTDALLLYANQIRRWAAARNGSDPFSGCDVRLHRTWQLLRDQVPREWQLFIPDGIGDGGLVGNFDEVLPRYSRDWQCATYRYRSRPSNRRAPRTGLGYLLSWLHQPMREAPYNQPVIPSWLKRLQEIKSFSSCTNPSPGSSEILWTNQYFSEGVRDAKGAPHEAVGHFLEWPNLGPWC